MRQSITSISGFAATVLLAFLPAMSRAQAHPAPLVNTKIIKGPVVNVPAHLCGPGSTSSSMANAHFTNMPCGIAISKSGRVAVSEYAGDGVKSVVNVWYSMVNFNSHAKWDQQITSMYTPEAVTFTPNETLIVMETTGGSGGETGLRKYTWNGGQYMQDKIGGSFLWDDGNISNPRGVVAIDNDNVLFTNDDAKEIVSVNISAGSAIHSSSKGFTTSQSAKALAICGNDIWVADYNAQKLYKTDLTYKTVKATISLDGSPVDLATAQSTTSFAAPLNTHNNFGNSNVLYVTVHIYTGPDKDKDVIEQYDLSSGTPVLTARRFPVGNNGHTSWGIAVDRASCTIYACDGANKRVLMFQ